MEVIFKFLSAERLPLHFKLYLSGTPVIICTAFQVHSVFSIHSSFHATAEQLFFDNVYLFTCESPVWTAWKFNFPPLHACAVARREMIGKLLFFFLCEI